MSTAREGRRFLTPGGVLAALLVLVVVAVCARLGFWQLDRLEQRQARNAAVEAALAQPPVSLPGEGLAMARREVEVVDNRHAEARGVFEPEGTVLLRGRFHQGQPGVHVVAPLRLSSGDVLLVNRGWIPAPDATTVDSVPQPPAGLQQVRGILQRVPTGVDDRPVAPGGGAGPLTLARLDLDPLRERIGSGVLPVYLQEIREAPPGARPYPVDPPELDEGPHLVYAVQWFGFAAVFGVGFLVVTLRRRRVGASG